MSTFLYREPGKIVQDIIQNQMGLANGQVMFTNEKYVIPIVGLYIVVSYVGPGKIISNMNEWKNNSLGVFTEYQSCATLDLIQIDIMSYLQSEIRPRRYEIALALHSVYSEQQQELYNMQIARQPGTMQDTSFLEQTKMITRYSTTIMTSSINLKQQPVGDYFTDFSRAVPPTVAVNA